MMKGKNIIFGVALAFGLISTNAADATTYTHVSTAANLATQSSTSPSAPILEGFSASFDDVTGEFNAVFDLSNINTTDSHNDLGGLFLVLTDDASMPSRDAMNVGNIYVDFDTGQMVHTIYSGDATASGSLANIFAEGTAGIQDNGGGNLTVSLSFNTFDLNALAIAAGASSDYMHASFTEGLFGVWAHFFDAMIPTQNGGFAFSHADQTFFDTEELVGSSEVPEPSTMALLGTALLGVARRRKKRLS